MRARSPGSLIWLSEENWQRLCLGTSFRMGDGGVEMGGSRKEVGP